MIVLFMYVGGPRGLTLLHFWTLKSQEFGILKLYFWILYIGMYCTVETDTFNPLSLLEVCALGMDY